MSASTAVGESPALESVLDSIDRTKSGGASLSFSRRNMVETIVPAPGARHLQRGAGVGLLPRAGRVGTRAALGGLGRWPLSSPVWPRLLAVRAFRSSHTYARTDRWDTLTGVAQTVDASSPATIWTGGVSSAQWLPIVVASAYSGR